MQKVGAAGKNCILRVNAKVVEILERKPQRGAGLMYKPVFQISFMERTVLIKSATYTNLLQFELNQEISIYINPNNPQDFMYESPYISIVIFADILACSFPLIAMLLLYIFF